MSPFLELAFVLAVILLAAKLAGYLSTRLGQPSVLGELIVGLLLGPTLINLTHLAFIHDSALLDEFIKTFGEMGVLLLMFLAGLELHINDLARNMRVAAFAGILGDIIPISLGIIAGLLLKMEINQAVFLGLTLAATSISISAQILIEMKALRSKVGLGLLGAAVFDDILVIFLFSTFLALNSGGNGLVAILEIVGRMVIFLTLSVLFGLKVLPLLTRRVTRLPISQGILSLAIVIILAFGLAAEIIGGMAAITGTFLAGLMFARTPEKRELDQGIHALSHSLFVPIFFVSIGIQINLREISTKSALMALLLVLIAITGKFIGATLGAKLANFSLSEAVQLGSGMIPRGEVSLIISAVGLTEGLIDNQIFAAIIAMVLVSDLITPTILRYTFTRLHSPMNSSVASSDPPTLKEIS